MENIDEEVRNDFYIEYDKFLRNISLKKYFHGLDFFRTIEYPLVYDSIKSIISKYKSEEIELLDIGSRDSLFPLFLAYTYPKCHCISTDIDKKVLKISKYADKLNIGNFIADVADARRLEFNDDSFDIVTAISTIEHILPEKDGDLYAIKEISRVLKKGGRAIITVPYAKNFKEDWQGRKERYLIRRYDKNQLNNRIIFPSSLNISKILFFGERIKFSKIWYNSPLCMIRFFTVRLANYFIHITKDDIYADGCFIILKKVDQ